MAGSELLNRPYIVKKYGDSLYVPMTKFLREMKIDKDDPVYLTLKDGVIVVSKNRLSLGRSILKMIKRK